MEKLIKGIPINEYHRIYQKKWAKKNPEKMRKKWRIQAERKRRKLGMKIRSDIPLLTEEEKRERKRRNDRVYARSEKRKNIRRYRYKTDIKFRLDNILSSSIWRELKENKKGIRWDVLVGYNVDDLKKHLESKFESWMSWDNYGMWHIDHIKPRSLFNYTTADCDEFIECWSLKNLQPLEKIANLKKGNYW